MSGAPVLASVEAAAAATDEQHTSAIATTPCAICGAAPGAECVYGAFAGLPAGAHYPGKAHTRRLRAYFGCYPTRT